MTAEALPSGCIPLGRLIECLMGCLDEAGVDERTPVRVGPEFGSAAEPLFVSGANVTYPAGDGWATYQPWVEVEYRRIA